MLASPTTSKKKYAAPRNSQHDAYSRQKGLLPWWENIKSEAARPLSCARPSNVWTMLCSRPRLLSQNHLPIAFITFKAPSISGKVVTLWKAACLVPTQIHWCWPEFGRMLQFIALTHLKHFRFPFTTLAHLAIFTPGHAFGSWTHDTQKKWFQNRARIFIYGYELQLHGGNASKSISSDFGNTFIQSLNLRDHPSES